MQNHLAAASRRAMLAELASQFAAAGIETPVTDARVLVCAAAGIDHAALLREPEAVLDEAAATLLQGHVARRLAGEPVARILGFREFWSLRFTITPDVLDPRADSEAIVEAALEVAGSRRQQALQLLDLGTGSGALLAALLTEWPQARGLGIDRSSKACSVARANLAGLDGSFGPSLTQSHANTGARAKMKNGFNAWNQLAGKP